MEWKYKNGVHDLVFTTDDLEKMKNGAIHTVKTKAQELITIHKVD